MHVHWEAITAIAAILSAAAVVPGVVLGVRQVRIGTQAIQLEGTMKIFDLLLSDEQRRSRRFIANDLAKHLADPGFRDEMKLGSMAESAPEHLELPVLQLMEMIGTYVKHGMLDQNLVCDYISPIVIDTWERLDTLGVISAQRETYDDGMWENFEHLYGVARRWNRRHASPR